MASEIIILSFPKHAVNYLFSYDSIVTFCSWVARNERTKTDGYASLQIITILRKTCNIYHLSNKCKVIPK